MRAIRTARSRLPVTTDDGFSLVEIMISLVVFAVIAAAVMSMLLSSLASTRSNRARVAAANLAARELEITRAQFTSPAAGPKTIATGQVVNPDPLPGGTAGAPLVVDGMAYTLTRVAQWQSQGATAGPCDGGASGQLAYLRVTVTVTWPRMGGVAPVTASTLLTPPLGTYASGTGHVKVKVTDANGGPEAGQTVTLTGLSSQQTAADGCAFFAFVPPGAYTVGVSTPGYVDPSWSPSPSQSVTVTANAVAPVAFSYAPAATLNLGVGPLLPGFPAPVSAFTAYNTAFPSTTRTKVIAASGPTTSLTLWPYPDGVTVWDGDCADADPQAYTGGSRASPLATNPGQTTSAAVAGAAVAVRVANATGQPVSGATVVAVHAADSGCPGPVSDPVDAGTVGAALTLPVATDATGTARATLPYGAWTFKVAGFRPSGSWPTTTLAPTGAAPTATTVTVR